MAPKKGSLAGGRDLTHVQQKDPIHANLLQRIIDHANSLQEQINKLQGVN